MADTELWLLLLLATLLSCRHAAGQIIGDACCDRWAKDGWKRYRELPAKIVEQRKPAECANAVSTFSAFSRRGKRSTPWPDPGGGEAVVHPRRRRAAHGQLLPGQQTRVTWTPNNAHGHLGLSLCSDPEQTTCFMLDAVGARGGRTGYTWRRHGPEEQGLLSWVPGRRDHVPETLIQSEQSLEDGVWPAQGMQEMQVNLERTESMALRVWLTVYQDTSINPLLMRGENLLQRPGNRIMVSWRPEEAQGRLGFAMCRDSQQTHCHVLLLFGFNGRLGFAYKRHSFQEAGAAGWVAGRDERVPGTVLRADASVEGWPQEGRQPLTLSVDRSSPGSVMVWVEGGEALSFSLPDSFTYFTVSSLDDRGATAVVEGAPAPAAAPPPAGGSGADECVAAIHATMLRGQEMVVVWEPRDAHGNIGAAFCRGPRQDDCYVLDVYGMSPQRRKLAYSWRRHGAREPGAGAWVPGRDTLLPETQLQTEAGVEPGWRGASKYAVMLKLAGNGVLEVRAEGQDRSLYLSMPEGYGSVTVASAQSTGDYVVRGPCYNGIRYQWSPKLCNLPDAKDLAADPAEVREAWTLRGRAATGVMRSPATAGADGDACVSVEALALGSARLTVSIENIDGPHQSVHLAEIVPEASSKGEWQRISQTVNLPQSMRLDQVRISVRGDQVDGSGLVLVKGIDFCNPNTCGVAPSNVRPLVAHGQVANVGDFPWFAGIFRDDGGNNYQHICGGSLISTEIVVSAAHCFYDETTLRIKDKSQFKVSVGKYQRDWRVQEPYEQRSAVNEIVIPDRYRGSTALYVHDIAFLRVHFVTSAVVVPLCFDRFNNETLKPGELGVVSGWGATEDGEFSQHLRYTKLPYVTYAQCYRAVPAKLQMYIGPDKFCAGYINGSTVWPGDSGGGLSFLRDGRWYLRGIVSTGTPRKLTYSAFTDVNQFLYLLKPMLRT
ncbi:hypothetical protein ONE63_009524 [Megalurothrips usitatus]|uniref:Peptidase S1 domain-containing protein n=1 Tax=Megalurothrips usitatus TaxID=439358 RepID=A0AAV7XJV1_9NEOP|nr:hypothetical protein ONE63_009524 [Megalurothrips usitatus]